MLMKGITYLVFYGVPLLLEFLINTKEKQEITDITDKIRKSVSDSKIENGICIVYVPHTTAGIIINENADVNVSKDILNQLEKIIPSKGNYKHNCTENNAHAHIKSSIITPSEVIIISKGKLMLGTWQGIALVEFDGPHQRKVFVKIIKILASEILVVLDNIASSNPRIISNFRVLA